VEALADMTPEQLEAIEGIGPKTVEKISVAVNNYFATLEGAEAVALPEEGAEGVALEGAEGAPENEGVETEAPVEAATEEGEAEPVAAEEVEAEPGAPEAEPSQEAEAAPESVGADEQKE
jgi:transcription termination/antitermination protein NusA